ncbi:MAG: hypothetical protein BWY78_01231 [Alphaproteobacteria bacterium ADurb.Bin438]|nr:MAG: hypothetical protein BWY78_01231 [Alphaproteobacteria bacterium ADurb.Bin438]
MVSLGETYVNEEIGDIYFNLKKYRLAYLYYEKAYRLTSVDGLKGIGDLYYNGFYLKQNYKKALYCYKKYYRKGGYKAYSCLKNIGDIYFKILKDDKNALYWYLKASRLEKSDFSFLKNVNENILKIYLKHEKYEKVIKFVKKNEFLKNSDTCQFLMGHAYLALKDEKNAFVCYLKVAGMQTHLNMNVRAIVSYLAKDKKTDVFGDIDAKNAIIRSSPYSKYLIGHNFFKGKYGHPKSYRHAKKWLLLAGMEGVKKAFIDLYHIAIHNEDIIEIETYKYFVPYEISKAYKCKKLSKDQEKLVLQNIKDLKNKIKFDSKFKKVEKKVVQEKLFGFLEKNNHKIISNPIINNIQINGLLYSNNKIIPIIIIDNIPLENKDLLRINKESLISNDKRLKNLTTDIEKIKDFLKEHFSDKEIIPLLISTRSMPFYQDKEFFIHRNFFLKDIGEMPSVINEEATPISKDLDEKIHKIIKTSFIKRIFGFIKKY